MKRIITILLALAPLANGEPNISEEKIIRFTDTVNGHKIEVSIHQGQYDFADHKISGGVEASDEPAKVDGVEFGGTDGQSPFSSSSPDKKLQTIAAITLRWDGNEIPVPKSLHINLLRLTLSFDSSWKAIQFVPRPSGEELLIQAKGGDGGASYMTSLVLRKNGEHLQYPPIYWESELPEFPYVITRYLTGNGQQDSAVEEVNWLEPKKQNKSEMATPRKPSD
jgi:hypothetical protein